MEKNIHQSQTSTTDELTPQIAKGAGITFIGDVLGKGLNFFSQIIIARLLGTELFGLYVLGIVVFNIAQTVSVMGLSQGALRYISIYYAESDKPRIKGIIIQTIGFPFLAGTILGLALFLGARIIANIFANDELISVIKIVAVGIPFMAAMMVSIVVPRGFKKMQYFVYVKNIFHPILNLVIIGFLFWLGFLLLGGILAWVLASVFGFILSLYYIKKEFPEFFRVKATFATKELFKFSTPLLFVGILQMLFVRIDILMLGYFLSPSEVGIYNASTQIINPLIMFLMAFGSIYSPIAADLYNTSKINELNKLLKTVTKWTLLLTLPCFVIIILSPEEILSIFGFEFIQGSKALVILSTFYFLAVCIGPVVETLIMTGKQTVELYNSLGAFILNIILNSILIPKFGINGSAMATGISLLSLQIARLLEVSHFLGLSPFGTNYMKWFVGGLVMTIFVITFKSLIPNLDPMQGFLVNISLVGAAFIGMLLLLRLDNEDKLILKSVRRKIELWT